MRKRGVGFQELLVVFVSIFYGCQQSDSEPAPNSDPTTEVISSYDLIQTRIFDMSCALCGCHKSEEDGYYKQHNLLLGEKDSYENLVGALPSGLAAKEDGLKRVDPGNPKNSLLLYKIDCKLPGYTRYGSLMPLGGRPLSQGQVEYITAWVADGASREGEIDAEVSLLDDQTPYCDDTFVPLKVPGPSEGYQIVIEPFETAPNFERELFVYKDIGNDQPVFIKSFDVKMRPNSHHFLMYSYIDDIPKKFLPALNDIRDLRNPDGSISESTQEQMEYQSYFFGSNSPEFSLAFPPGVALKVPAHQKIDMNAHYVNNQDKPITGEVQVNLYTVDEAEVEKEAQTLFLSNYNLSLMPGETTVETREFTFEKPVTIFILSSHNHKYGERFEIFISGGSRDGELIYESTDWAHPVLKPFDEPIVLDAGQGLTSRVTYNNTTDKEINFGYSSEDEMSIILGYYY